MRTGSGQNRTQTQILSGVKCKLIIIIIIIIYPVGTVGSFPKRKAVGV
jgi:hypothetical protein